MLWEKKKGKKIYKEEIVRKSKRRERERDYSFIIICSVRKRGTPGNKEGISTWKSGKVNAIKEKPSWLYRSMRMRMYVDSRLCSMEVGSRADTQRRYHKLGEKKREKARERKWISNASTPIWKCKREKPLPLQLVIKLTIPIRNL